MKEYYEIGKCLCQYFEGNDDKNKNKNLQCICKYANDIQQCVAFTRHYRDRHYGEKEHWYTIRKERKLYVDEADDSISGRQTGDKEEEPEAAMDTFNEILLQQELDKIHCYFVELKFYKFITFITYNIIIVISLISNYKCDDSSTVKYGTQPWKSIIDEYDLLVKVNQKVYQKQKHPQINMLGIK